MRQMLPSLFPRFFAMFFLLIQRAYNRPCPSFAMPKTAGLGTVLRPPILPDER
jgi:hypothetical protein